MLTPKYLQRIVEATEKRTEKLNRYLTAKIVDRILYLFEKKGEINVIPSSVYDAMKQEATGKLMDDIVNGISEQLPDIQEEVKEAFYDAAGKIGVDINSFTRKVIEVEQKNGELLDVDISKLPDATDLEKLGIPQSAAELNLTPKEIRLLESAYRRTNGEIYNLTQTCPVAASRTYIEACDSAYWKVTHGVAPSTAITEAIDEVSSKGITTVYYGSRTDKIETAIARAVRTGVNQANGDITLARCAEMGVGYVLVNSHIGARVTKYEDYTNHSLWQGKVYKLDWSNPILSKYNPTEQEVKENKKSFSFLSAIKNFFSRKTKDDGYEDFIEKCGYGKMLGICGINCRHSFSPFYPGVNINTYKTIATEKNRQRYELEQKQRAMERSIRETKRRQEAFTHADAKDEALAKEIAEKRKQIKERLKKQISEYYDFCKTNRLSRENYRLYVAKEYGVENSIVPKRLMDEYTKRSRAEIETTTKQIRSELDNVMVRKSKWSGNVNIVPFDAGGVKEWNCSITIGENASDMTIRHELIHSYSVSYYDKEAYLRHRLIEEASTEFLAREIGKTKGELISEDAWDIKILRNINSTAKLYDTDYEFAVALMNKYMPERISWLISVINSSDISDVDKDMLFELVSKLEGELDGI